MCLIICGLLLFELRAAPLIIERGEADPDAVTLFLKETQMRGGVAHLPAKQGRTNARYTLRQADHRQPLITAYSGFTPPLEATIETLSSQLPVTEQLIDVLETAPTSYLVVHWYTMPQPQQQAIAPIIRQAVTKGRLRLVRTFPVAVSQEDIYVFTANEPNAP